MIFSRHESLPGNRRSQVTARPTDPRIKLSADFGSRQRGLVPASAAESASEHPIARRPPKTPASGGYVAAGCPFGLTTSQVPPYSVTLWHNTHLVFPLVCVEVQRVPRVGDLSRTVAAASRAEQVRFHGAGRAGPAFGQHRRPGLRTVPVALRAARRLRVEQVDWLARGVVEHAPEVAVRSNDLDSTWLSRSP